MRKRVIPFAKATSLYDVDLDFFVELGVKVLLSDLDNTLDPYTVDLPTEPAKQLVSRLKEKGIRLVILSNNSGKRVGTYAKALGVEAEFYMKKPFSGPLKRYLKRAGLKKEEVMLVGDQIMTDVKAGNGAGIRVLLTEPLYAVEPPWTKFNRFFDKPVRKKLFAKNLVPTWQERLSKRK